MLDKIKMIVFVLILGAVWSSALVGVDRATRGRIEAYNREKVRKSVLSALGIDHEGKDIDTLFKADITEEKIAAGEKGEKTVYRTKDGAVAFEITGPGSQGPIRAVMALEQDLDTIRGVTVVNNTETPGLGDRVLADDNMLNFRGKKLKPRLLIVKQGEARGDNEVDAITGATLTGKALEKLLNEEAGAHISLLGKKDPE